MNLPFNKNSGTPQPEGTPEEKKKQSALLVLLLVLVGGFSYLYFFTGLIKPPEAQKVAEAPAPAPQIVKMPLPPHGSEPGKPDGRVPEKAEVPKGTPPVAKPGAAPPVLAPAPAPAAKPAPAPPAQKEEPKKVETGKTADKKPQPVAITGKKGDAAKSEEDKPAADTTKPVVASKKDSAAKAGMKKPVSDGLPRHEAAGKAKNGGPDSWSLVIGNYVLEEALSADMGRVRKAGFEPVIKPSARKKTEMNRLFVSEYHDRASAQPTLEKLKRITSDAFVIEQAGMFTVYAGSYMQSSAALSEKERLKAAGITVSLERTTIAIPSQSLSIGPFTSKHAADAALRKLKSAGIKATFVQK